MAPFPSLAAGGVALIASLVLSASASADVSGRDIISFLNAQRAANGIPAGITEDSARSSACRKHNSYQAQNGGLTVHSEDPSKPGYSREGDDAARNSVLYGKKTWTANANPFEEAPIHLSQLLAPRIDTMGAGENNGFGCATTKGNSGRRAPAAPVTYTYPGNGRTGWTTAQTAFEGPYTPGQRVGIPLRTRTGPYLYAFFDGPDQTADDKSSGATATLTEPGGSVDIAVVDQATSGMDGYIPLSALIIPKKPLKPNTVYTASVSATVTTGGGQGARRSVSHTWSFTTGATANQVDIIEATSNGRTINVLASTTAPGATVTATGPGPAVTQPIGPDGKAALTVSADGPWKVCVRSGGTGTAFQAAEVCRDVAVMDGVNSGAGTDGQGAPFMVSFPVRVSPGRAFNTTVVGVSEFSVSYIVKSGRKTVKRYKTKRFKAGTKTFKVKVPSRYSKKGKKVKLTMKVTIGGKTYTSTRTITFG